MIVDFKVVGEYYLCFNNVKISIESNELEEIFVAFIFLVLISVKDSVYFARDERSSQESILLQKIYMSIS